MSALKFVPDWLVTSKMMEKLDSAIFSYGDIFFPDVDSNMVKFLSDDMGFNIIDLNNININDDNFDEDDPETINHARLNAWHNRFKKLQEYKKQIRKELMPAV